MESESNLTIELDWDRDGDLNPSSPIFDNDTFNELLTKDYYDNDPNQKDANVRDNHDDDDDEDLAD